MKKCSVCLKKLDFPPQWGRWPYGWRVLAIHCEFRSLTGSDPTFNHVFATCWKIPSKIRRCSQHVSMLIQTSRTLKFCMMTWAERSAEKNGFVQCQWTLGNFSSPETIDFSMTSGDFRCPICSQHPSLWLFQLWNEASKNRENTGHITSNNLRESPDTDTECWWPIRIGIENGVPSGKVTVRCGTSQV